MKRAKATDQVFGTWVGQLFNSSGEPLSELYWSLVLVTSTKYPTAFGASLQHSPNEINLSTFNSKSDLNILQGTWTHSTQLLQLKETNLNSQTLRIFSGKVFQEQNATWFQGDWTIETIPAEVGKFVVRLEEDDKNSHISGLWLGEASPDISLRDFYIPTNPTKWALSFLKVPNTNKEGENDKEDGENNKEDWLLFGSGNFDDSADIMGKPLLFYLLCGRWNPVKNHFEFLKEYEDHEETRGYNVNYSGSIIGLENNNSIEELKKEEENEKKDEIEVKTNIQYEYRLKGNWKNEFAGSWGQFTSQLQSKSVINSTHIFVCSNCQNLIKPGEMRYSCTICRNPWACCQTCYDNIRLDETQEHYHIHKLIPETIYNAESVEGHCSAEIIKDSFVKFYDRNLFCIRANNKKEEEEKGEENSSTLRSLPPFEWFTYEQVGKTILNFINGIKAINSNLNTQFIDNHDRIFAGFCSDVNPAYIVTLLSSLLSTHVILPIHGALDPSSISIILNKTQPALLIVEEKYLQKIIQLLTTNNSSYQPQLIVVIPSHLYPQSPYQLKERNYLIDEKLEKVKIESMENILYRGEEISLGKSIGELEIRILDLDEITAILYTSGSTGTPKGAVFKEELVIPSEGVTSIQPFLRLDYQPFDPTYLLSILSTMQSGGCRVLASMENLMDDFKETRPTHFGATPIFWNSLYQEFCATVAQKFEKVKKSIAEFSKISLSELRSNIEIEVGKKIRADLGNRLFIATCGGAPISPSILSFVKDHLKIDIVDLYGSRECGGIARDGFIYPGVDVIVKSVPELGYYEDNDPPRGEIYVSSPRLISGYWNDPDLNKNAFEEMNGKLYYRTGDIGELTMKGDRRCIRIIDRSSSMLKLAQGEWISPAKIEIVLEQLHWVDQALVLASSVKRYPVVVIVPSHHLSEFWDLQLSDQSEEEKKNQLEQLKRKLLKEIRFLAHNQLKAIEIPQAIHLETSRWTEENDFLTSTLKKKRNQLANHYQSLKEELYSSLDNNNNNNNNSNNDKEVDDEEEKLVKEFKEILERVFPNRKMEYDLDSTFTEIGGDSLSAARLLQILREEKGLNLSTQILYEYPLSHIAKLTVLHLIQFSNLNKEDDWNEEYSLLDQYVKVDNNYSYKRREKGDIFCTGVTGFLGPFILFELLLNTTNDVKIYCLVRGKDNQDAKERLRKDIENSDLWGRIEPIFDSRVVCLCGDLIGNQFGLSDEIYNELVEKISLIIHSGARVNMTMPYSALKETNVMSTLKIINLALKSHAKVTFVSSIGAIPALHSQQSAEEFFKLESNQLNQKGGYGQTKVISEWLLHQAITKYQLEVCVIRPSAICGDSSNGVSNLLDIGNILLSACVELKVYPLNPTLRFQWIPVDFVAKATVLLSQQSFQSSHCVFNLIGGGPHLNEVFDVMKLKGFDFKAIGQAAWNERVEDLNKNENAYLVRSFLKTMVYPSASNNLGPSNCTKARSDLEKLGVSWPSVSENELSLYIHYFKSKSFFKS